MNCISIVLNTYNAYDSVVQVKGYPTTGQPDLTLNETETIRDSIVKIGGYGKS
jgi:hypothetical protein